MREMLGRYTVLHELGRGATAAVYAARDKETGAVVALKRLDPTLLSKAGGNIAEQFLKQARSAARLRHGNIASVYDAGETAGTVYVAMEMLEGESLRKVLDDGPLPVARTIQVARDIAAALAHAHLEGVVHGALRPSNIFVLPSGQVKVADFGIRPLGPAALPSYLSPEQVRGDPADHRSDLFSFGAVLHEMLTHQPPFEGDSPQEVMENILHAEPPLPSELNPHVPRALDAMVSSMLAKDPARRLPGAPIALRELEGLEKGLGLGLAAKAGTAEPKASVSPPEHPERITDREAFDYRKAMLIMERESQRERASGSRPGMFGALAVVLAVLAIGLAAGLYYSSRPSEGRIAASAPETPVTPPVAEAAKETPAAEPAAKPAAPPPEPPRPVAKEPEPVAQAETAPPSAPEQTASAAAAPAKKPARTAKPAAKPPEQRPGGTARLILAVSPRGEIYIDGKHHGTTPPMTSFDLEPGMHRIEVRSGSRKPFLTYMTVEAGEVRHIRHDFNAKPIRPPA